MGAEGISSKERVFVVLAHLSPLMVVLWPLLNVIPPLLFWIYGRKRSAFIDRECKEILNMNISLCLYGVLGLVLSTVVIGLPLLVILALVMVFSLFRGALAAGAGRSYRYCFNLRPLS